MSHDTQSNGPDRNRHRASRVAAMLVLTVPVFGVAALAPADPPADSVVRLALAPESRLWLEGGSSLHDWSCDAGEIVAEMRVRRRDDVSADAGLPDAIERVRVDVPVDRITCGNGTMEEKLREALDAADHPRVTFRMDDYAIIPDSADPGTMLVGAQGTLTIAGTERPIQLSVMGQDTGRDGLRITGSAQVLMSEFGVKPPTAMLGLLKTDDRVLIQFELVTTYERIVAGLAADGRTAQNGR